MRLRGLGRINLVSRRIRNRFRPGALILLYHRIADLPTDPQWLSVAPPNFDEHLEVIKKVGVPVALQDLAKSLDTRKLVPKSIVVTFDDGAADNLLTAKPLLKKHAVPATVFVSTGYVQSNREYWWDELDRLLLQPGTLPERLELNGLQRAFSWHLTDCQEYSESNHAQHRTWNVSSAPPTERHRLYKALIDFLLPLLPEERLFFLDELKNWAGNTTTRNSHRALSPTEIEQLADEGLVEIGAHSVTHSVLAELPLTVQRTEIGQSKKDLEDILGAPIKSFAYPFGTLSDYTEETVRLVKESGFEYACSNFRDVVQPGVDLFQLPRVIVRNWDGNTFENKLERWLRG